MYSVSEEERHCVSLHITIGMSLRGMAVALKGVGLLRVLCRERTQRRNFENCSTRCTYHFSPPGPVGRPCVQSMPCLLCTTSS